ncbi:hypothetical protein D3C86_265340 [compost metagenome]
MSSISSIPTSGPLPNPPLPSVRAHANAETPQASAAPVPTEALAVDHANVLSGQAVLNRVVTTSLWAADFELPSQPTLPPNSKKPWDWESTPDITLNDAGGTPIVPRSGIESPDDEEEEDWNFFDFVSAPVRAIGDGLQQGAKAIDNGVNAVVGAIGDAASNAWKAITSFRLW